MECEDHLGKSIAQVGAFEDASQNLVKYYIRLDSRNLELSKQMTELKSQLAIARDAYDAKAATAERAKIQIKDLQEENETLKRGGNFAAVLLDGDGCIWAKDRILLGLEGGKVAASDLRAAIERENIKFGYELSQTVVTLFLNKRGLLGVLKENGVSYDTAEQFLAGLNLADPLITCVDCAHIKEGVDEKLKAFARLYSNLPQCKQIYLGVSHDKSYASTLEMFKTRGLEHKVRLLQSYDFIPKDLKVLSTQPLQIDGLFMRDKLANRSTLSEHSPSFVPAVPLPTGVSPSRQASLSSTSTTSIPSTSTSSPTKESSIKTWVTYSAVAGALKRRNSSTSSSSSESPTKPSAPELKPVLGPALPGVPGKSFRRDGAKAPVEVIQDIKEIYKKRPCHYYYLRRDGCCYGDNCTYCHNINMTKDQLRQMRSGAKTQPCYDEQKTGCHEDDCFRGHSCPYGSQCTNVACKFRTTPGMHPDASDVHLQDVYTRRMERDQQDLLTNGGMYGPASLPSAGGPVLFPLLMPSLSPLSSPSSSPSKLKTLLDDDTVTFPPLDIAASRPKPIGTRCVAKADMLDFKALKRI